jgi:hypothetical protein
MSELPKPPESQPPTSSDDWEDKKASHTNRPVPKSWKWMLGISLMLTVCSSGVAVITYLDNRELARELGVTKREQFQTLMLLSELKQHLKLVESSLNGQQLQSAKNSLNDATKSTQEIEQQLAVGGPPQEAAIVKSLSAWLSDLWSTAEDASGL